MVSGATLAVVPGFLVAAGPLVAKHRLPGARASAVAAWASVVTDRRPWRTGSLAVARGLGVLWYVESPRTSD